MKRKLSSEENIESFEERQCKLPETVMNYSANHVFPSPKTPPRVSQVPDSGEADTELRRVMDNFINIYEQLGKCDGPDLKPNYSYTELAYLAMLRSPNFCLPITEIYRYIQSRFAFFKNSTRKHWKNAVRHSLAKTLCFTKIEVGRGKSSSGNLSRSTYLWCIIPSSIASFARGDYRPSADKESGTNTLRWGYYRVNAGQFWDQVGNFLASKMVAFKKTLDMSSDPGKIFESQVCHIPKTSSPSEVSRPLTSLPVFSSSPGCASRRTASQLDIPSSYCQNQMYINESNTGMITSVTPNLYKKEPVKLEVFSPEPRFGGQILALDRTLPIHSQYRCQDSGNESRGCDSSSGERRVFLSCRQQYYNTSSPVMNLSSANCSIDSAIDIAPFEVPELSDFSRAVSPVSQLQEHSLNDSGYALDYSFSYDTDFYRPENSCQYAYDAKRPRCSLRVSSPTFETEQKPHLIPDRVEHLNYENHFLTNSDPMLSNFSENSSWML